MDIGVIIRRNHRELIEIENDPDYYFLDYLETNHDTIKSYTKNEDLSEIINREVVLYIHFPHIDSLSKKLSEYENKVFFINKPSGVRKTSPKTYELSNFSEFMPESIYISNKISDKIIDFIKQHPESILKPVNGTGGKGIEKIYFNERLADKLIKIESALKENSAGYILQEFIKNKGDKRILCFNGQILGHVVRYNPNKFVNNISSGGHFISGNLTQHEINVSEIISNKLITEGIYLVGLDFVESKLMEINTAMPGCLAELNLYKHKTNESMFKYLRTQIEDLTKAYNDSGHTQNN